MKLFGSADPEPRNDVAVAGRGALEGSEAARWLDKASMMAFAAEYRNASTFLRTSDLSLDEMIAVMAAHGFKPLLARRPKTEARSVNTIYRYQDIAMAFGLRTDPTVIDDPEFQEL